MSSLPRVMAISLWQPWAAAIALGDKQVETRHWFTGAAPCLLAIHAAKRWSPEQRMAALRLEETCGRPENTYYVPPRTNPGGANTRGAVVALAWLSRCEPMTPLLCTQVPQKEFECGNWAPGRWAWALEDVAALEEPYSLRGRQGIWTLPAADAREVLRRVPVDEPIARLALDAKVASARAARGALPLFGEEGALPLFGEE